MRYNVKLVRDIRKATIVSVNRGEVDVEVVSPIGIKERISRLSLKTNYRDLRNKKINMLVWKKGKSRLVVRPASQLAGIAECRKGIYVVDIGGEQYKIPKRWFRKMFVIESKNIDGLADTGLERVRRVGKSNEKRGNDSNIKMNVNVRLGGDAVSRGANSVEKDQKWVLSAIIVSKGRRKYECSKGDLKREIEGTELERMCNSGMMKNVCVARSELGKKYFRGVGCKLADIPKINR